MLKLFNLTSTIEVKSNKKNLNIIDAILNDESKKIGNRAEFTYDKFNEKILIKINANDAVALKAAISSISSLLIICEKTLTLDKNEK